SIIVEKDVEISDRNITIIKVKDSRASLSKVSSDFYDNPSKNMEMIGITGTNGKTTITYLVQSILECADRKTGIIGTIGSVINGELKKTENTTPESLVIQKYLHDMHRGEIE